MKSIHLLDLVLIGVMQLCVFVLPASGQEASPREGRVFSATERQLIGRWQGNDQKTDDGRLQRDFYIFANDGSYAVAIRVFDSGEKKWKRPSDLGIDEDDGFSGFFFVSKDGKALLFDHWFASRQVAIELKGDSLVLRRTMDDAPWTMLRVSRFDWEDPELSAKIDRGTLPPPQQTAQPGATDNPDDAQRLREDR